MNAAPLRRHNHSRSVLQKKLTLAPRRTGPPCDAKQGLHEMLISTMILTLVSFLNEKVSEGPQLLIWDMDTEAPPGL